MKNLIFSLAAIIIISFIVPLQSHSQESGNHLFQSMKLNRSSIEMVDLLNVLLEVPYTLMFKDTAVQRNSVDKDLYLEINIQIDLQYTEEIIPAYWNEYAINTEEFSNFISSPENYIRDFTELINNNRTQRWDEMIPDLKVLQGNKKEIILNQSVFNNLDSPFEEKVDLADFGLVSKDKSRQMLSSIGSWQFRVGPGDGFDY